MTALEAGMSAASHFLHRHLLKVIVLSYALAALVPGPGLCLKEANVTSLVGLPDRFAVTPPKLLLWLLLFNAGLRVKSARIGGLARRPGIVLAALAANLIVPLAFLALMVPASKPGTTPTRRRSS